MTKATSLQQSLLTTTPFNSIQLRKCYYNLGNALQDQGDLTAAIARYRTAVQLNKNFPDAHNNLGKALHAKGQLTEALSHHLRALEINPSTQMPHTASGFSKPVGNIQGSKHLFQRALELDQTTRQHFLSSATSKHC